MQRTKLTWLLPLLLIVLHALQADAQTPVDSLKPDYITPTEYEVGGIDFVGLKRYNKDILLSLIGLDVGDKVEVPSEKLADIIDYLWKQNLFSDVKLNADSIVQGKIYLCFVVEEIPYQAGPVRLKGISKAEANKLATKLKPYATGTISQQHILSITTLISDYYKEKGYYNVFVSTRQVPDKADTNLVQLIADITTGPRVKINSIDIVGNRAISDTKLRRVMKDTKERRWYNVFKASKFNAEAYTKDKQRIIDYYNQQGFRDAEVVKDSVYLFSPKRLNISITIDEHKVYYFGDITWIGNTTYSTDTLNRVLGIKRGEVYDNSKLNEALYMNATGSDITSLYMDNGYLFFNVVPVETGLNGDTINLEMHIHEGGPTYINKIIIKGNTRTQDHVILRELYTKPGQLFRRSDLIMSQQALVRLGYFNPDIGINPIPDPVNGTVDIEYVVEEKPTDQIQLSGGIAAGKVVGTLSLVMNNFSFRNIVKKDGWRPLPAGDGQRVAISAQSNGPSFQSYSLSVTEPWLGGKKPNSLTGNVLYNSQRYSGDRKFSALGVSLGLGNRWKRPDNFFSSFYTLNFYKYYAKDFPGIDFNGNRYDVNIGLSVSRNSLDGKDYPMEGSSFTLGVQATPPWSGSRAFTKPPQLVEYHKWNFDALWYQKVVGKLVFKASASVGYLGYYNKNLDLAPVNRFYMGGVQLAASSFVGHEYVNMRGYENGSLSPTGGSALYNRFVLELRYPILLKPQMGVNIYGLAFAEAGNVWNGIKEYNPSVLKRSAGAGIRVVLPMFGLIGMDAGYGFDTKSIPGYTSSPWQFHFVIGKDIK